MNRWLFAFLSVWIILFSTVLSAQDTIIKDNLSSDSAQIDTSVDLKIGERLFKGLISTGTVTVNCAGCHTTNYIDTLNWNPSAFDIAIKYLNLKTEDLKAILKDPSGNKMTEAHSTISLDDQQIFRIKSYLDQLAIKGEPGRKPLFLNTLLFILSLFIAIFLTMDLLFLGIIKYRFIHIVLLLMVGLWQVYIVAHEAIRLGRSENWAPLQPIKFSHKVHANGNKIDCKYCHHTVEYSKSAGIPSANVCLNCHSVVREGTRSGKFEIARIHAALENNRPIRWIKVHNLPDFVFFSHAQHVAVGKVECKECHGEVESMDVVRQVSDLSMGFCIECHREKEVPFLGNTFYSRYKEFHEKMKEGKIKRITVEDVGGTDCMKCHY